ncbi:MAG TPA: hypothetical protein PK597_07300 [Oscillospiraceae bacterium]|nr:hypothetical protein [Oscillospiraceae bacterium]
MLFRKGIEPRCAYCAKGKRLDEERVLCLRAGVVEAGFHCGAFRYDPLKRTPPRPAVLDTAKYRDEDFVL